MSAQSHPHHASDMMSTNSYDSSGGLESRNGLTYRSHADSRQSHSHSYGGQSYGGQSYAANLSPASMTAILTSLVSSPIPSLTENPEAAYHHNYNNRDNNNNNNSNNNNSDSKSRRNNPNHNPSHNSHNYNSHTSHNHPNKHEHRRGSRARAGSTSLVYPYPVIESDGEDTGDDGTLRDTTQPHPYLILLVHYLPCLISNLNRCLRYWG